MSRSRGVVFYGLLCVLIAMHFTVRPMLGWRVNVDFLVLSVLIIAVRARPGAAAVCGFGLGLMADSLTPAAFGAGALALTVVGFGASWLKSAFFADNAGVNAAFVFLGGATIASGVSAALSFPFGLLAVERGTVTVGVMSALANIIWSICGLLGPLLGGLSTQAIGDQAAFGLLASVALLMSWLIYRQRNKPRPVAAASGDVGS